MSGRAQSGTWNTYDAQNRIKTIREVNFVFEKTTEIIYNHQGDRAEERRTVSGNSVMPVGVTYSLGEDGVSLPASTMSHSQRRSMCPSNQSCFIPNNRTTTATGQNEQ